MDIKVSLIIDGENFDDISYDKQLKVKNRVTDKVGYGYNTKKNKRRKK